MFYPASGEGRASQPNLELIPDTNHMARGPISNKIKLYLELFASLLTNLRHIRHAYLHTVHLSPLRIGKMRPSDTDIPSPKPNT